MVDAAILVQVCLGLVAALSWLESLLLAVEREAGFGLLARDEVVVAMQYSKQEASVGRILELSVEDGALFLRLKDAAVLV